MSSARWLGIILTAIALVCSISCEKHHLGEYPEVQKDLTTTFDKETLNAAPRASTSPTPVTFFSEKKSP